jgi:tetratricopeptide (TPR) repeat protein
MHAKLRTVKHSPERWRLLLDEFERLIDMPDAAREARFASMHESDPGLESQLRDLLQCHLAMEDAYLDKLPPIDVEVAANIFTHSAGDRVGPYQLLRELGRGGMGEVWLARRDDGTFDRQVALKLPHAHLLSQHLRQRFRRERNILATLNHPNIAALYDAGVSESGMPFLAMEWIDGIAVTDYCRTRSMPLGKRLELFRQVLDAVHYAHARFVAHRDIKPSNILVASGGVIKLLDFGIAKLLRDDTNGGDPALTQLAGLAATPAYAAPEQLAGQPVTTAVDVYALGVVMFELLTGGRPNAGRSGGEAGGDPPLASSRATETFASNLGGSNARALRKALRGDLDAVIATAIDPDPAHRYRSAAEFAEDLRRSQSNEPISVRRIGIAARIVKLGRRHRLAFALASSLVIAVIAGGVGIARQALLARQAATRAALEAKRAELEATRERTTKEFLISVFEASDPRVAADRPRGTITAKELLDANADRIPREFKNDPETQIELLNTAATIYYEFREWPRYRALHRQAQDLARAHYGELHPVVINSLLDEIEDANEDVQYADARVGLERVEALIARAGLEKSKEQARWLLEKGRVLESESAGREARIAALRAAVDLFRITAPSSREYAHALGELGLAYADADQFELSAQMHVKAIWHDEHVLPSTDSDLGQEYSNLGLAYWYLGRYDDAEHALSRASDIVLRTVGPGDSRYWESTVPYARVVHQRGDWQRAHEIFERILSGVPRNPSQARNARETTAAAYVREVYATCLAIEGRAADAVPLLEDVVRTYLRSTSVEYDLRRARLALGDAYEATGRRTDARIAIKAARDEYMARDSPEGIATLRARERWARYLFHAGEAAEARKEFLAVIELDHSRNLAPTALAYGGLAEVARERKDPADALKWSQLAIAGMDAVTGMRDARTRPYLGLIRAKALLLSGDAAGASRLATDAAAAFRSFDDPSSPDISAADAVVRTSAGLKGLQ